MYFKRRRARHEQRLIEEFAIFWEIAIDDRNLCLAIQHFATAFDWLQTKGEKQCTPESEVISWLPPGCID